MQSITPHQLQARLEAGEQITLIDVREDWEHEECNIGGQLIPLGDLASKIHQADVPEDQDIVVYCRSGSRSAMAQQILIELDYPHVLNLEGGVEAWSSAYGK